MSSSEAPANGRSRVVLITGEPGSGKTTLGTELARVLRVPFLARDDVRGGLFLTSGSWSDRPEAIPSAARAVDTFLRIVEAMADLGVSCVVEYLVRLERPDDLDRLTDVADVVVIQTWCHGANDRFAERTRNDPLLNRPPVLRALGAAGIEEHTTDAAARMREVTRSMRTDFDLPLLRVGTDDGYEPPLDEIVAFATRVSPRAGRGGVCDDAVVSDGDEIELSTDDLRVVARYAAECAQQVLAIFEDEHPDDRRPREAIEVAWAFADGGDRTKLQRTTATAAHRAAKEASTDAAREAATAAGHAAAAAYLHPLAEATQVRHILGAAANAARAAELAGGDDPSIGDRSIDDARRRATPELVAVLVRYPPAPSSGNRVTRLLRALDTALRSG